MKCKHTWTYRNGRSWCLDCGAWALDLRCFPQLRQQGGQYPTATDLQNHFACYVCGENLRTRLVEGQLRIICDGAIPHDISDVGRAIPKAKRDYIHARQETDAMEVLDGLPEELRTLLKEV